MGQFFVWVCFFRALVKCAKGKSYFFGGEKSTILGFASCEGIFRTFLGGQKVRFEYSQFYNFPPPPVIHLNSQQGRAHNTGEAYYGSDQVTEEIPYGL